MFSWANKQLEYLAETMAPMSATTPSNRFLSALSKNDDAQALACLDGPFDESNTSMNPHAVINTTKGCQPIHLACQHCSIQVLQSLIQNHGARVDTFDYHGNTGLHYACMHKTIAVNMKPVDFVKLLVNEYKASVTVKNAQGQTPYDVCSDTLIRQFLLPIQLKEETQQCLDQGGQGLPPGIDMGGINIVQNIAPPPTSAMPPPVSGQGFGDNPAINTSVNSTNSNHDDNINMLMCPPPTYMKNIKSANKINSPPHYFSAPNLTSEQNMVEIAQNNEEKHHSATAPSNLSAPPPIDSPNFMQESPDTPADNLEPNAESMLKKPITSASIASATPTSNNAGETLKSTHHSTSFQPPSFASNPSLTNDSRNKQLMTAFPPPPNNNQSMRPKKVVQRTFIKPDGFHSSSSDPNLQQKYGHLKKKITVDQPPPTKMSYNMPLPPPPFASSLSSSERSRSMIQNRYLAYDAVTGKASSLQSKFPPPPITNKNDNVGNSINKHDN